MDSNKREISHPSIGNVPNIGWRELSQNILVSEPPLRTSGHVMNFVYVPPGRICNIEENGLFCVLRGSVVGLIQSNSLQEVPLTVGKSLLVEKGKLRSGENSCLLFADKDEDDNNMYFDDIYGMEVRWSEYDTNMYRTIPQIYVEGYRVNLWYLGPHKHGGIHNHENEPVPFVEFHLQLRGSGWMVKYGDKKGEKELERIDMVRGYTHDLFCSVEDNKVTYPWHEYIAGEKGSLFIVFEDTRI